jgi:ABC-type transporter Mla subunit MlaD
MTTFKAGVIGLVLLIVFVYLGFTKFANPFASPYTVHAVFSNANGLRPQSLVRIAGVNVGKVESVQAEPGCKSASTTPQQCNASEVTMTIDDQGLPLHKDATFAIRPRIFLEGNFFVDVHPGSPSAPTAPSGYTFPIQQGTEPVQFDQVLTSLQGNTRRNLQILLQEYGRAVKKAGPSYNNSIQYWLPAYEYSAIVNHDALGIQPHDLSNWIDKAGSVANALDAHPQNLKSLITDFNTTAAAFARENVNLERTVAELPRTINAAMPAFNALNQIICGPPFCAQKGPFRRLAVALVPATKSTGPMIDASLPFIHQLRLLVRPSELQGLTKDLAVTVPALTRLTLATIPFMRDGVRPLSSCVANVIIPWSHLTINDPKFNASNGFPPRPVYVEGVDFLPGLAGESRDFDANGPYIRILGAIGNTATTSLQSGLIGGELAPILGAMPPMPPGGKRPPIAGAGPDPQGDVPNVACETQPPITDLSTSATPGPAQLTPSSIVPGLTLPPLPVPLPPLPGLSRDRTARSVSTSRSGGSGNKAPKYVTPAQRKEIDQQGLFNIATSPPPKSSKGSAK